MPGPGAIWGISVESIEQLLADFRANVGALRGEPI